MTAPMPPVASGTASGGASSPWGGSQTPWGNRQRRPRPPTDPNAPQAPGAPPTVPQTFAQMQAAGQARPGPSAPNFSTAPSGVGTLPGQTMNALAGGGPTPPNPVINQPPQGPTDTGGGGTPGTTGVHTTPYGAPGTTSGSYTPTPYNVNQTTPGISGSLTSAVQNALQNPSPYSSQALQAARASGTAQLEQQFGAQRKSLDEEMARRGVGASSIAGGYYGDLEGQQANAQAGLESSLLTDMANRNANDQAVALGAGQGLYNAQGQQGLGYAQLGLQNSLGGGALGLGAAQLNQQGSQFLDNLRQQLDIARMGDVTQNRGIDVQGQSANAQLAALLAALGYTGQAGSVASGASTTPATGTTPPPTTPTPPSPTLPPNTGGGPRTGPTLPNLPGTGGTGGGGPPLSGTEIANPSPQFSGTGTLPGGNVPMSGPTGGLPGAVGAALGQGNAGAPNVPGAGTPNAPNGPMGPSGQQQGPSSASSNFAVSHPSSSVPEALATLQSMTGVDPSKFGFGPQSTLQEIDAARGLMSGIGNRDPAAIQAGMQSTNPFIKQTAYAYNMGYGSAGLPAQVAQQLGL